MAEKKLLSLNCPNCGASLKIPSDFTYITCNYCNSSLSLFHNDSITSLKLISSDLQDVKEGTSYIALELRYKRLFSEFNLLLQEQKILLDKIWAVWDLPDYIIYDVKASISKTYEKHYGQPSGVPIASICHLKYRKFFYKKLNSNDYRELLNMVLGIISEKKHRRKKNISILNKYITNLQNLIGKSERIENLEDELFEIRKKIDILQL